MPTIKVITFRSRELKKNTINLAAGNSAAKFSSNETYNINGKQFSASELSKDELADIKANTELNQDMFYSAPATLDAEELKEQREEAENKPKKKRTVKQNGILIGLIVVIVISVAVLGFSLMQMLA